MKTEYDYKSSGQNKFISGVFVLGASTVIVKIIGLLYKIPMLSLLGAEGMGYFNSSYEIYALLCIVSTSGLPTALSILIAQSSDISRERSLYQMALRVFLILGTVGSLLMLIFARSISLFIENENAYYSILAIAPALFCVCISSAVRGYFQGHGQMLPTALSQLIEAIGKLLLGILFANYAIKNGYPIAVTAAFAVCGLTLGTFISAIYLVVYKAYKGKKNKNISKYKQKIFASELLKIALPITLSSAAMGITRIIDMTLIMRRLQDIGYTQGSANEIYGAYTTMALPIFSLVPSLLSPISLALIPELSRAIENKSRESQSKIVEMSLRMTIFFAMPASLALVIYAGPVMSLLFSASQGLTSFVSPLLSVLSISVFFSCILTTTNAILQSYKQATKPIISMLVGCTLKIITEYILIGIPSVNIYGAPVSTLICDVAITIINLRFVYKYTHSNNTILSIYFKPFLSSILAVGCSLAGYYLAYTVTKSEAISFIVAVPLAIIVYFLISFISKSITEEDVRMLPMGDKINNIINKISFISNKDIEKED